MFEDLDKPDGTTRDELGVIVDELRATLAQLRDAERNERTLNGDTRFLMRVRAILSEVEND